MLVQHRLTLAYNLLDEAFHSHASRSGILIQPRLRILFDGQLLHGLAARRSNVSRAPDLTSTEAQNRSSILF